MCEETVPEGMVSWNDARKDTTYSHYYEFMKAAKRFETHNVVISDYGGITEFTGMCRINTINIYLGEKADFTALIYGKDCRDYVFIRKIAGTSLFALFTGYVKTKHNGIIRYAQFMDNGARITNISQERGETEFKKIEAEWKNKNAFIRPAVRERLNDIYILH